MTDTQPWLKLVAAVLFLRVCIAIWLPIDLAGDESYYWEWGRNLDYGYFSKPPLIGWLMSALAALGLDSESGIRVSAAVIGSASLYCLGQLTAQMTSPRHAFRVVALLASAPFALPANLFLTIDSPLVLFWSTALLFAWRTRTSKIPSIREHLALAATLSLGVLTKQIMLAFIPLWWAWLLIDPARRQQFATVRLYVVSIAPIFALAIPLWWNSQEDWVTLQHTASHFEAVSWTLGKALGWLGAFIGSQWVLWGLIPLPIALNLLVRRSNRDAAHSFLAMMSLPALGVVLALSFRQEILPNWAAVFWLPVILQAGISMTDRFWRLGILVNLIIQASIVIAIFVTPYLSLARTPFDRVMGWETYAEKVATHDYRIWSERSKLDERRVIIVVGHRYFASQLAFYHPDRPSVRLWDPGEEVRTQYGIWNRRQPIVQKEALIVVAGDGAKLPVDLRSRWTCLQRIDVETIAVSVSLKRKVEIWYAKRVCNEFEVPSSP